MLLFTDGLERGDDEGASDVGREFERLQKSCRGLIWLKPAPAIRPIPGQGTRDPGDAALRRRVSGDPQLVEHGGSLLGAGRERRYVCRSSCMAANSDLNSQIERKTQTPAVDQGLELPDFAVFVRRRGPSSRHHSAPPMLRDLRVSKVAALKIDDLLLDPHRARQGTSDLPPESSSSLI